MSALLSLLFALLVDLSCCGMDPRSKTSRLLRNEVPISDINCMKETGNTQFTEDKWARMDGLIDDIGVSQTSHNESDNMHVFVPINIHDEQLRVGSESFNHLMLNESEMKKNILCDEVSVRSTIDFTFCVKAAVIILIVFLVLAAIALTQPLLT